jgi:D,D-heptose 1,7-bisphosphate phosphatase
MQSRAIFLDKDGTLIPDIPYNSDPSKINLLDGVGASLIKLEKLGYKLFIISNQSGIANGYFTESDFNKVIDKMHQLFNENNVPLAGFYYCPHHPNATKVEYSTVCDCRKPLPGMILRASKEHDLILEKSWFIGDILNDVEAGNRAGCKTVLINNGNETEWLEGVYRIPGYTVKNFSEAAEIITKHSDI